MTSPDDGSRIERAIPREVVEMRLDPVVALLVTLYILYIGEIVGQEMAATAGLPPFPADKKKRIGLMHGLSRLDPHWAVGLIEALEQDLRTTPPTDTADETRATEDRLLAAAILNQRVRTESQGKKLAKILSVISENAVLRDDLEFWTPGVTAIGKLTRLIIEAVIPTRIGTMTNLSDPDSGLRHIATLGGALFLGYSIGVLTGGNSTNPQSPYAVLGGRIAELTAGMGGQRVSIPTPEAIGQYIRDLQTFARRGDSIFAMEHPFHFRVLLEVLSDENRRYPAEPVLNVAALLRVLPSPSFWAHVTWSRQQLPVVVNLLRLPEKQRAHAYIQHYAAFGRTPHTSSFTHLDYEVRSPVGDESVSTSWPAAFQGYCDRDVRNMPNSVCQVIRTLDRERSLGRLWRGTPEESDLRWLCGQLVEWDGHGEPDGALADRLWHSDRWTGQTFPVAAMTEIRVGAWLLEALRLRLAAAVAPAAPGDAQPYPGQEGARRELTDREFRANEELRCVLEIMALFTADYLSGDEDGLPGLKKTLGRLRGSDWFSELGRRMSEKLDRLEDSLGAVGRQLEAELHLARTAVPGAQA
jgi:hypothetical protein